MAGDRYTTRIMPGRCPEHGEVQATKEVPSPSWPILVYLVRRSASLFTPYRCPQRGEKVERLAS